MRSHYSEHCNNRQRAREVAALGAPRSCARRLRDGSRAAAGPVLARHAARSAARTATPAPCAGAARSSASIRGGPDLFRDSRARARCDRASGLARSEPGTLPRLPRRLLRSGRIQAGPRHHDRRPAQRHRAAARVGEFDYTYPRVAADVVYLWPERTYVGYAATTIRGGPWWGYGPYWGGFWGPTVIVERHHR